MGAKIITLSVKDQDLLRVALNKAMDRLVVGYCQDLPEEVDLMARIRDLKERLL